MAPDNMEIIGKADLPDIVRKALVSLGRVPEWAPIYVTRAEALATGNLTKLMKERPPTAYIDAVDRAVKAVEELDNLITCAGERAGKVIAQTTRAVRIVFEGLAGYVAAARIIPGYVASDSLVYGDGNHLYVVTTEVKGRLHIISLPQIMPPRIPVGVDEAYVMEEARKWSAIWTAGEHSADLGRRRTRR